MGPLQLAVTWYKIHHAGEQATHWDIQNKDEVALFWISQWTACSPAWRILYHVTASCKGPIEFLQESCLYDPQQRMEILSAE